METRNILIACTMVSALAGPAAWAAKPTPDKTPPADITPLTVVPAVRALTLRFPGVGDDGLTGQAAGYEVRYRAGSESDCVTDPSQWTQYVRGASVLPVAAGTPDAFTLHPLAAGTPYCVAIKARDEVPNLSVNWARQAIATLAGDWSLTSIPLSSGHLASSVVVIGDVVLATEPPGALVADPSQVLTAWTALNVSLNKITGIGFAAVPVSGAGDAAIDACSNPIVSPCAEAIAVSDPVLGEHVDALSSSLSVAAIPGEDRVAAILINGSRTSISGRKTTTVTKTLLLERDAAGTWTSEVLPFVVASGSPDIHSTLAYVRDLESEDQQSWIPAVTYLSAGGDPVTLRLAERRNGVWYSTPLFARASGGFLVRKLMTKPDGSLAIWTMGNLQGYNAVLAERALDGVWSHVDAGPVLSNLESAYGVGRDAQGELLVSIPAYRTSGLWMIRQADFSERKSGLPDTGATGLITPDAWRLVAEGDTDFAWAYVNGVDGNSADPTSVAMASQMNGARYHEYRLHRVFDNCSPNPPPVAVDQTMGGGGSRPGLVMLPDGGLVLAYGSRYTAQDDFVQLARGSIDPGDGCGAGG